MELPVRRNTGKHKRDSQQNTNNNLPNDEIFSVEPNLVSDLEEIEEEPNPISKNSNIHWNTSGSSFISSKSVPKAHVTRIADITNTASEVKYFFEIRSKKFYSYG